MKASVEHLRRECAFSQRRACLLEVAVSTVRYHPISEDGDLRERLQSLARERPRFGSRQLHALLGDVPAVNHKPVFRVYQEAGLAVKRGKRKRLVRCLYSSVFGFGGGYELRQFARHTCSG